MARPPKPLIEHIRDGTFRQHRHGHLLASDAHIPARFRIYRDRYKKAHSDRERRAIALDFRDALTAEQRRRDDLVDQILHSMRPEDIGKYLPKPEPADDEEYADE